MTWRARLIMLFPALLTSLVLAAGFYVVAKPGSVSAVMAVFMLYGFAPLAYRLHRRLWPLHQGLSRLDRPVYSPWWGAHQIQLFYDAFPALEALLRLIPGAYSAWLRAWGSRIGRRVHWTPRVDITDRGLLEVGDDVIFGHLVGCYAHVVDRRGGRLMLYSKPIRIGAGAFIGAGSRLGPGARIEPGSYLPALTDVGIREIRRAGQSG
jgi:hypothetical protein